MTDCAELHARIDALHLEARLGVEEASRRGAAWDAFTEQMADVAHCESLADVLEERVAEDC